MSAEPSPAEEPAPDLTVKRPAATPTANDPAPLFFCGSQKISDLRGAERQTEFRMSDLYQAYTPRVRDAPSTSPTITAEDVRTMMLSRIQAAQAR
jgi:hypothetical protein